MIDASKLPTVPAQGAEKTGATPAAPGEAELITYTRAPDAPGSNADIAQQRGER